MSSSDNPKELLSEIEKEIKSFQFDEASFERMKKVWIANEVKMIDDIDSTVHNIFDDYLKYRKIISNKVDIIRSLSFEKLKEVFELLDFSNKAVVIMKSGETI